MKNNVIIAISVAILLLSNIFSLRKNHYYAKALYYKDSLIMNQNFMEQKLQYIESNLFSNIKYQNVNISNIQAFYNNKSAKPILKPNQKYAVVYRYHDTGCEACINFGITKFKKIAEEIGTNNVMIFVKTSSTRTLQIDQNTYDIHTPMFMVDSLPIVLDQLNIPYFFILDSNMNINNLFIPDKSIPGFTDKYSKEIQSKYFQ